MYVFDQRKQVGVLVTERRLISALKEVPNRRLSAVEIHPIALVEPLKDLRERYRFGFHWKMDRIFHQHIGLEQKVISDLVIAKNLQIFWCMLRVRLVNWQYRVQLISFGHGTETENR